MAAKRPITVDDLYQIQHIEDPNLSPDGQWIAYVHVSLDKLENEYKRNIWLVATSGGKPVQITRSNKDAEPRWSPDGKTLAFTSGRNKKPQIYLLPMTAPGEPRALTNMPNGASSTAWSPDGQQIAYLAGMSAEERAKEDSGEEEAPPKDKLEAKQREERKEQDEKERFDPRWMWRIPYRVGTSFLTERYAQIYVIPTADGLEKEAAKPRRLTDVDATHDAPRWSADGKAIYTARALNVDADLPYRESTLYRITVADKAHEQLTDDSHLDGSPRPSPDGKWVAYSRVPQERLTERTTRLTILPTSGGAARDLNLELDCSVDIFRWTADSSAIVFNAGSKGDSEIYRVTLADGKVEKIIGGRFIVEGLDIAADGGVTYCANGPDTLPELFYRAPGKTDPQQMTSINQKFLDEVIVQETHEIWFKNPHGHDIQGWYLLPVGYEEGKTYPLALNIHGGPHVMWGPSARSMWHEWQLHAASGYAVFYCNPRGSDGYGESHTSALHKNWGEVAFDDIMAGVDTLLEKGFVDAQRMAVTGGSYGGYMTAWVVGHTDRFAAAVTQRGVYNLLSFYGTSDVPLLITNEFDAEPWEDPDLLWKHSPLAYAHKITTPLLIIHSENDFRVPIAEGEQLFAFVKRSGGTVKMLRFPRDGHELSRSGEPAHRVKRLTEMVNWFDQYCKA